MNFFELDAVDISSLNDGDLRDLVARLCEAELVQQGLQASGVTWGGAQEAADGGLDVNVKGSSPMPKPNFVPKKNTGFQVKKHAMSKAACQKEMTEGGKAKDVLATLAASRGAYIIVSGKDDCSEKMLTDRVGAMKLAISGLANHADLHLDFYGRDRLLTWIRCHPGVSLWARSRLGKPLAGWRPFGRWAGTPPDQDDAFLRDEHPCVIDANSSAKAHESILEGIQLTRDRLRYSGSTVRITGLSGVGKTRFAQALFEADVGLDSLPASDVIYADLGTDLAPSASELVSYLTANDFATYLVLDNCPPDVHRLLQKQVAEKSAKLHLLTIEYDISDDKPEETEVIHLEPSSEKTVSKLLQRRFPDLGQVNADRIAEFAGGNARVGLALANRVKADETLSNFSDEALFQRLFSQRKGHSSELLNGAEVLALVYSFNASRSEYGDELNVLGSIGGLSRQTLHRNQGELFRRQLTQQRGNWRAILPHALANRLAKRALENIPLEDINTELFKPENLRLFKSCAHRLGYLHDSEPARALALSWLHPEAPLGNIAFCNGEYLTALEYVAPVFPDVVLRVIEQAAAIAGFASRENPHFTRFVHLLYHLAYDDDTFDGAAAVLLKFAETEKSDENNDSVVRQLKQLFSLYLSGTVATPLRRQAFVRRLLASGESRHRQIAKELLASALRVNGWTSHGAFHFGARKRGHGWIPATNGELFAWYIGYVRLLLSLLESEHSTDRDWAKAVLPMHFRGLWVYVGCFDLLEQIIRDYGSDGRWVQMWLSIKYTLHFDGNQHELDLRARLESLEKLTSPSDPCSEIEAYVLFNTWDHIESYGEGLDDKTEELHETARRLGELVGFQPEYLQQAGSKLWEAQSDTISSFGKGLATGSRNRLAMFDLLVKSLRQHWSDHINLSLLVSFINAVHIIDTDEARHILERALDIQELKGNAVDLLLAIPVAPWTVQMLIELARRAEIGAKNFEALKYSRIHEAISDRDLAALLGHVNALDQGYASTIRILVMRFFRKEERAYFPAEDLCAVARVAIRLLVSAQWTEVQKIQLHGMIAVAEEVFNPLAPESEVKDIIGLLCGGLREHRLHAHNLTELINAVVTTYPEFVLEAVFDGSDQEETLAYWLFKGCGVAEMSALNLVPIAPLLAWCGADDRRLLKVARAVHTYSSSDPNDAPESAATPKVLSLHIKAILEAATDKLAIIQYIFENFNPLMWSESLADILKVRRNAIAELLVHPDIEVQTMVKCKLSLVDREIAAQREKEATEHHRREQSFE